jgi:hypothetical protein
MGFKGCHMRVAAIDTGFQVTLLKTHALAFKFHHSNAKTHAYSNAKTARAINKHTKVIKTHTPVHKRSLPRGPQARRS